MLPGASFPSAMASLFDMEGVLHQYLMCAGCSGLQWRDMGECKAFIKYQLKRAFRRVDGVHLLHIQSKVCHRILFSYSITKILGEASLVSTLLLAISH